MNRDNRSSGAGPGATAADRLAALKARVAAAVGAGTGAGAGVGGGAGAGAVSGGGSKGGLNVPLHPALEDLGSRSVPPRATGSSAARGRGRPAANPYLETSSSTQGPTGKQRQSRKLVFNQKGKYIQQANALRRQAALEAMKKRIADQARKAGIDDVPSDKNFAVEAPPEVEWFDQAYFIDGKTYDDLDKPESLKITTPDTLITELIQHPVPIEPPQDQHIPPPKPMYLTKQEQKKVRRQRRMADLKEKQAKIRLGLLPAEPVKTTRKNLMRVLGEEAVLDPTAVEMRVNREIQERHDKHLEVNEERKLTKEKRHEKLATNQEKDASKGIHLLVFRIDNLANGQHRFKIWKNAEQLALTGVCIMHPKTNLVIVEGGEHSINKYRKLMVNRIDWTQNTPSSAPAPREWLTTDGETFAHNQIKTLFDGEVKARTFKKWSSKIFDTDREAFDFLARTSMESFWTQAREVS